MTAVIRPIVNLNGSSKNALMSALLDVSIALHDARDAMARCTPHGRDYQPYGDTAALMTSVAREIHLAETRRLDEIDNYVTQMMLAISDQEDR